MLHRFAFPLCWGDTFALADGAFAVPVQFLAELSTALQNVYVLEGIIFLLLASFLYIMCLYVLLWVCFLTLAVGRVTRCLRCSPFTARVASLRPGNTFRVVVKNCNCYIFKATLSPVYRLLVIGIYVWC